jgi:hypothetical protein
MERKDTKMWNDRKNEELHLFPMVLLLGIALAALLVISSVRAEARQAGEEIPQQKVIERTTSNTIQNDEPAVYRVEARLLPA